jgi:copper chaperone NosL
MSTHSPCRKPLVITILSLFCALVLNGPAAAGDKEYIKPAARDKCPVCGMFVAKYPDWIAEVLFKDGSYRVFDGPKDMFKYVLDVSTYEKTRTSSGISTLYVMDYYAVQPIDASKAFYVIGSDIYGPMGAELIPFEKEADAKEFMKDHDGRRILRYRDITPQVMKGFE